MDHRPGRGATAVHDIRLRLPSGVVVEHVLALTTDVAAVQGAPGTLVPASGDTCPGVWVLPHDPALPGLAPAMDTAAVAELLSSCGVPTRSEDLRPIPRRPPPARRPSTST